MCADAGEAKKGPGSRRGRQHSPSMSHRRTSRCRDWTKNALCSTITLMHPSSNTIFVHTAVPWCRPRCCEWKTQNTSFHKFTRLQTISSRCRFLSAANFLTQIKQRNPSRLRKKQKTVSKGQNLEWEKQEETAEIYERGEGKAQALSRI